MQQFRDIQMITLLLTVSSLTTVALAAAALSLAVWSYRRLGVTMFIWLILARISGGIASLAVAAPNPENAQKEFVRLQKQMESGVSEALHTIWMAPITLSVLSTLPCSCWQQRNWGTWVRRSSRATSRTLC